MSERHIIKITVDLRSAKLLVRFPCKLTFQLKTDSAQAESRNAYELKKGECFINEILEAEAQLNYDPLNGQYEDKKVRIFVQMASANGVIPAGNVTFNPCNKEPLEKVEYTLPLEKCPDRSAQINFLQSYTLLRKTAPDIIYQSQVARETTKLSKVDLKYSSASNLAVQRQINAYQRQMPRKSPREKSNNSKTRLGANYRDVSPRARVKTSQAINYRQEEPEEYGESQVVHEEEPGYQRYTSRYIEPSQKAYYVKEIARLKGQIKSLQADERWDQLLRVKEENQFLTNDLEKAKEKIRMNERRERQLGVQLKETKEQSERTKNKYLQSQSLKNEGEVIIADKERIIKDLQNQLKRFQEKMADLNAQLANQQKRVEFKESSYQEQLRKMNEKYTQSEAERQKVTFDYNTLLAKLEETEKKHQANAKEKERNYSEEKNRLIKKIDSLTQQIEKLKEEQNDRETHLNQNILLVKSLTKKETERQEKLGAVESELELAKMQLKKELDQRKLYEQEIAAYKLVEEERNQLRKKNNELATELGKTNQKLERTISELTLAEGKARDLDSTLVERTKERDTLNAKVNSQKKEIDSLTKEQDRLTRENQSLSAQSFNAGQKINDLKSNIQSQKNEAEEMRVFYQEQLAYIAKSKEYSDGEVQEHKWKVDKYEQQCNQINAKLRQANSEILTLNETILVSTERAKRAEQENKELNSTVDFLKKDILDWEQKERTLNEEIKTKNDKIYQLTKKIQNNEGQLFIIQEKMKQILSNSEERKSSDEKSLREREKQLSQKSEELTSLQLEVMTLKEELASSSQEVTIRGNEINYLKESVQSFKQDLTVKETKLDELKEELKLSHQLNETLSKEVENLAKICEQQKKAGSKMKKEWEDYKNDTTKALNQLLEEIGKDQEGAAVTKQNLLAFPDQTLSAMQVEAFKKRNAILVKYQMKLLELNQEKVILEGELKKNQKLGVEKEEEHETLLKNQKQRIKQLTAQSEFEREQLNKKIQQLEENKLDLSGQIQKLTNEIKKREEHIQEQKEEIRITLEEIEALRSDLKLAEEKILGLKSNEIKWKATNQSKFSQISEQNQAVMQRYKLNIAQLQRKLLFEEKNSKDKEEIIKKQQVKISEINYQKEKSEIKALQLNQKVIVISEEKKDLEKRIKQLEKEVKDTSQQITNTKEALLNEKAKFQEVQAKLAEAHSLLTESQVDAEKLKAELEAAKHSILDLEDNLKDKGEKAKVFGEKSSLEVKQLKEKIITLNSAVELKEFQVSQLEGQLNTLKDNLKDVKEELSKKKLEAIGLADKLQEKTNQEMYNSQNIDILKNEKEFLEEENERFKERVAELEEDITEAKVLIETADLREKELIKLKEDYQTLKLERDRASNELRTSLVNQKVSNITASRIGSTDDRKRVRELEQLLEAKHVDLAIERKKLMNEFEREKRAIVTENAELKQEVENLQGQFDFQRAQLNKEIESLSEEIDLLTKELNDKTEALAAQEQLLETITTEENAAQIQEGLANIRSIFERNDVERRERGFPVQSVPDSKEQTGVEES